MNKMTNKEIQKYESEINDLQKKLANLEKNEERQGKKIKSQKERNHFIHLLKEDCDSLNKQLFYNPFDYVKNVASMYVDQNKVRDFTKKNKLSEFRNFFQENNKETINRLLFEIGLINSDNAVRELNLKNALEKNGKKGRKYKESESTYEIMKILAKNNEFELLSGAFNLTEEEPFEYLPFQMPPEGISLYAHSFKLNYTLDCAKNQKTKRELKELRDKRINDLFFNLGVENTEWYVIMASSCIGELLLREKGIKGQNLFKKIYENFGDESNQKFKNLNKAIYNVQFEQQGKILQFMAQEPTKYLKLIQNLADRVEKNNNPPPSSHSFYGYEGGSFGFSGSNGGPIGKLEKISKNDFLGD